MQRDGGRIWLRAAPLAAIVLAGLIAWALGAGDALSLEALTRWRAAIAAEPILAPLIYILAHIVIAGWLPPGSILMVMGAGFLFGPVQGVWIAYLGNLLGAFPPYIAARRGLGEAVAERAGPKLTRARAAIQDHAFKAVLGLRVIPALPYFFLNLAAGLAGARLRPYAAATAIGLIPPTLVFALIGAGAWEALGG